MRTIAIFGKYINQKDLIFLKELLSLLQKAGFSLYFHNAFAASFEDKQLLENIQHYEKLEDIPCQPEVLISLGGDGTFLDSIVLIGNSGIPLMGVNLGRLGFLAAISKKELQQAIAALQDKKYDIDQRSLLHVETNDDAFGARCYGMNDMVIGKYDKNLMTPVDVFVDGNFLNRYYGDGLIISTSTGSTAYNLSAGGPILLPNSENFIITPIASHTLTVRPLIIPDKCVITVKAGFDGNSFNASLDSVVATFHGEKTFVVSKEKFCINTIRLQHQHFFDTLREKLMWGSRGE